MGVVNAVAGVPAVKTDSLARRLAGQAGQRRYNLVWFQKVAMILFGSPTIDYHHEHHLAGSTFVCPLGLLPVRDSAAPHMADLRTSKYEMDGMRY